MRASYRKGVEWIAWNDEPEDLDAEVVAEYVSTGLLADLFGKDVDEVARAVVRKRKQWQREEASEYVPSRDESPWCDQ